MSRRRTYGQFYRRTLLLRIPVLVIMAFLAVGSALARVYILTVVAVIIFGLSLAVSIALFRLFRRQDWSRERPTVDPRMRPTLRWRADEEARARAQAIGKESSTE